MPSTRGPSTRKYPPATSPSSCGRSFTSTTTSFTGSGTSGDSRLTATVRNAPRDDSARWDSYSASGLTTSPSLKRRLSRTSHGRVRCMPLMMTLPTFTRGPGGPGNCTVASRPSAVTRVATSTRENR